MTRLLVVGASGGTGKLIVAGALERGYRVTAVSRNPHNTHAAHANLTVVQADLISEQSALDRALAEQDVVISALGKGLKLRSGALMATATPVLLAAMKRGDVKRLVFISAFGVPGTPYGAPFMTRLIFNTMLSGIYADKALAEAAVRGSATDWTILAPVRLNDGAATGRFRLEKEWPLSGPWVMTRADMAAATLSCVDAPGMIRQRLVVGPV